MRIGIFGGTFDPIHIGHLLLAEQCREACALDRVIFVPAGQPPHKSSRQITAGKLRVEMVELAIAGHAAFSSSSVEIERTGPSYSADTVAELAQQHGTDELFFLVGSDSLSDLPHWYQPHRITDVATLVVACRPGNSLPNLAPLRNLLGAAAVERLLHHVVPMPLIEISSTAIRDRAAARRSIRYLVPRAVECFIDTHGLYRSDTQTGEPGG